jgi:hypothetical protein
MICAACGKQIGFWGTLRTDSAHPVCKECHEQARKKLQVLVGAVGGTQSFKPDYGELWISQLESTVQKYQMPESEAGPLRFTLLNGIFAMVESQEELRDADLNYVVELVQRYRFQESAPPEITGTLFRIGLRQVIQGLERAEMPSRNCNGLVLQKDEICHWEEAAGLRVVKTRRQYVGAYNSLSIPVPLVRGMRYRVGGFKGHPIDETVVEEGGAGVLHVTNQRVCFTGPMRSMAIPYKKVISIGGFDRGLIVQTENEKKPGIFVVRYPELTTHVVTLASSQHEETRDVRGRRKALPPT